MSMTLNRSYLFFFVAFASCVLSTVVDAREVSLTRGKAEVVSVASSIADVLVADPGVVDVGAIKQQKLYLVGTALGDTNILLFDSEGHVIETLDVHVRVDEGALQSTLRRIHPDEDVVIKTINDDVLLTGRVSSPAVATSIRELAMRYAGGEENVVNMLDVAGEQQVMIKVRVAEISRTVLNELGIDTTVSTSNLGSGRVTGGLSTTDNFGLSVAPSFGIGTLTYQTGSVGPITLVANALERDGLVNTLAEPNLTAVSGENARFLAGGEFPIPSSLDQNGNIVYEYKPFGVSLAFKPVVLSSERINLQISTEVSEVSAEQTLELPGITIPSFSVRRAETTVELGSGGSIMLAGLIESQALDVLNQLPGVKKLPVLGDLVSSERFARNESELIVMITAFVVEPFADTSFLKEDGLAVMADDESDLLLQKALIENLSEVYGDELLPGASRKTPIGFIVD